MIEMSDVLSGTKACPRTARSGNRSLTTNGGTWEDGAHHARDEDRRGGVAISAPDTHPMILSRIVIGERLLQMNIHHTEIE